MPSTVRSLALVLACTLTFPLSLQAAGPNPERVIVKFRDDGRANGLAAVHAAGGSVVMELGPQNAAAAHVPAVALQGLRNNPHIEYVEQDMPRYPSAQTVPYGIPMVQADQVGFGGSSRRVCIIDSGYQRSHDDLQDTGVTATTNSGSGDPYTDTCGHGTHVAGTIAGLDNSVGVVGVNRTGAIDLHIVKVFGGTDCAWTYSSNLIDAANKCAAAGANVISMSLGCSGRTCKSATEENTFNSLYAQGILSIAAAGNDGTTALSYPASYNSVVSVAAVDQNRVVADFSQKNSAVEVAAPGVGVLSTVPWLETNSLTSGSTWSGGHIEGAARTNAASGVLVDGGLCNSVGTWAGRVVLCQRGTVGFVDKINNVKAGGGVAAIVYNNVTSDATCANFAGTLGEGVTSTLPAISLSCADGAAAVGQVNGLNAGTVVSKVEVGGSGYEAWDGTSMATPHVSGVAALVWSHNASWTNAQIREALQKTAQDLGTAGRDNSYGYGLVRASAALSYLQGVGSCTPTQATESLCSDGVDNDCDGLIDNTDLDCQPVSCQPLGTSCTTNSNCCSGSCKSGKGGKTCK